MEMREGLQEVERELLRFPLGVVEEFRRAVESLDGALEPSALEAWARQGVAIAGQTVRSWEAASEYFRVSPAVLPRLGPAQLERWARWGALLCQDSPAIAVAYFRASPTMASLLSAEQMEAWAVLGRRLYKGTWKSSTLASRFFEVSPTLGQHLGFAHLERLASFIEALSYRSFDLAAECLTLAAGSLPLVREQREAFTNLLLALSDSSWREVKGAFEACLRALPRLERGQRGRFLALAERLARNGYPAISSFLQEGSLALAQVGPESHGFLLSLCESLLSLRPEVVPEFLRSAPRAMQRLSLPGLEQWVAEGAHILRSNPEGGMAFFRLESARAERALESLSSGVELARIKEVMRMYCRALAGATVEIAPTPELVEKGIGWASPENPTTEGTTVYLPPLVNRYSSKEENFAWYKVVATHQVAHLEFGSFRFSFERPSAHFRDLRPYLADLYRRAQRGDAPEGGRAGEGWPTDLHRFFALFRDRRLALDLFTVLEDSRLDERVKAEYAGIRGRYARVQQDALGERPPLESLPAREALVELLVRLSLSQREGLVAPAPYAREARALAGILRHLLQPGALVEDTAEATIRAYSVVSQVPNEEVPEEEWQPVGAEDQEDYQEPEDLEELVAQLSGEPAQGEPGEGQEQERPYRSPQQVDYRGDFKPELSQLLAHLKQKGQDGAQASQAPLSREMLEKLLAQSVELEAVEGEVANSADLFAANLLREAGVSQQQPPSALGQGPISSTLEEGGPLEAREPNTFVYDEWDFRAMDYKPRWCIVRERELGEGDTSFWYTTLQAYAPLIQQIRRQFELVVPENFRKIKRLRDGEEFELDAVIEAILDKRTGNSPSDKIYWRRNKVERDVAVIFLLDMSASTAEAIDEMRRHPDDGDAPDDPVEYMLWLRNRGGVGARRTYKRIIDLEKESAVLLIQALEALGDRYGIYGFSGYGRENVEFYRIKDVDEAFSDRVRRRIDKIAPLHATRMGPAIRHATTKLEGVDAKTKVLFLISDGRPQDRGYSREGVEKEYAVHDTRMALLEAKKKAILPFCLTVDRQGHDYLKTMCADMGYEVLGDIHALPSRLLYLYRKLTV